MNSNAVRKVKIRGFSGLSMDWNPVFAGATVGLAASICLNILGAGIGFVSISYGANYLAEASVGAMFWIFITAIISTFVAGATTGIFTSNMSILSSVYHSVVTWALSLLVTLLLLVTAAGAAIGGTGSLISQIAATSANESVLHIKGSVQNGLANLADSGERSSASDSQKDEFKNKAEESAHGTGWTLILATVTLLLSLVTAIVGGALGSSYRKIPAESSNF